MPIVRRIPALSLELSELARIALPLSGLGLRRYADRGRHNDSSRSGNLKQLHEGDAVFFEDADGNRFHDEVAEIEILSPDAVEEMTEGDGDLPLFTCTLDGGSRVTVRCVLTEFA